MLERLLTTIAQVKAGNNLESWLNENWQIVYSLYQSKQINKKVYNNIIKSIQILIDNTFINSENSKTSKLHVLVLKITDNIHLRRGEISIYYTWKNIKSSYSNNKFKVSAPTWNDKFELTDRSYSLSDIRDCFEYIL